MMSSSPRDNWERLVAAVVKRDQIWQLFHQDSISTATTSSLRPSNSSAGILSISSNGSKRISVSPPRQRSLTAASGLEVRKNASGPITWKLFFALLRRRKLNHLDGIPVGEEYLQHNLGQVRRFSLQEVQFATENFHNKNIIARGIRNKIYKGRLADGSLVAVKRLTAEFQEIGTELGITSIAAHRSVLRASGVCITKKERLLIYPFMANGSVASQLRERQESLPPLNWPVRKQIALGAAKGLAYLHYECPRKIIHRDIKAANILLDEDFDAVVSDFNLSEFMDCYDGDGVTGIKGTLGHIAPEYHATGKYSVKADVFGYGVFLLELITAQKSYDLSRGANDDDVILLNRVKGSYKERKWKMMIDADLRGDFVDEEVEKLLQIALICTQTDPGGRPTMLEVVRMLEVGYGLAERWEELYNKDFKDENMELGHLRRFTIHELQAATEDFSNKIISKDGFNMVYKGSLSGSPVAVKKYNSRSLEYYFQKELDIGRNCLHPNIIHVIGCCNTTPEEQLLVFRLMVNGSVESWLKGRHETRPPLAWQKRKEIALGGARGLAYLHDKCGKKFIHRDIKAANILLDENFEAVVADFGAVKFMDRNQTHVTTAVRGTIGHIAPEYLATGECSDKTDVYSYGVFLLELITGQTAFDLLRLFKFEDMMLIDWVKRNYELSKWEGMVDEDSGGNFMEAVVKLLVQIALLCTRCTPHERPKMSQVVRMLEVGDCSAEKSKEVEKERMLEVGDGSAKRSKEEVKKEDGSPYSEWIIDDGDSIDGVRSEELSGPR